MDVRRDAKDYRTILGCRRTKQFLTTRSTIPGLNSVFGVCVIVMTWMKARVVSQSRNVVLCTCETYQLIKSVPGGFTPRHLEIGSLHPLPFSKRYLSP